MNLWRGLLVLTMTALALGGCRNTADVSIGGTLNGLQEGDSVFVTLSRDWDRGVVAPISFQIDEQGRFALRFEVTGSAPPVTFVKNGTAAARFEFKDTWGYAPVIVEKLSGKEFPVTVKSEGILSARVTIP